MVHMEAPRFKQAQCIQEEVKAGGREAQRSHGGLQAVTSSKMYWRKKMPGGTGSFQGETDH